MDYKRFAELSLDGRLLDRQQCLEILGCPTEEMLELLTSAFKVRENYFGHKVTLQVLINAKSGQCNQDCAYCSQSSVSHASIDKYQLADEEVIVKRALFAKDNNAQRYCIVTSGSAPTKAELDRLCQVVSRIKQETDIEVCTSLGFISEDDAYCLKDAGVNRYNHNLNTSERFYPQVCTTHDYTDRVRTLQNARAAGLSLCSGALLGMGESDNDIVDIAFALREVDVSSIPVNFLHPIRGTSLEGFNQLNPLKCLSILSLFRFINPAAEIRVAGGREFHLRSLQPLALYPANSIFVSGYLTTEGQMPQEDIQMVADMGFELDREAVEKVQTSV